MYFLLLLIVPLVLGLWAQHKVMSTYKKFAQIGSRSRITGAEAAQYVLRQAGITDVEITKTGGQLTDHYDPSHKRLVLSEPNYHGTSLAALGVAAHEAGHAIQHAENYGPLHARMALVPMTMFSSQLLPFVIFGGLFFNMLGLIWVGVAVYAVLTLFQLITLPVEFDASNRAKAQLTNLGIIDADERPGVTQTLDAAGFTYVAAFVSSLGNLLYFLMIALSNRD